MKLEKECYIGNVYYTGYRNGKYNLNFNCIISNSLTQEEKEIFDKLQEKIKIKLILEKEEPILDEAERKYLSDVIRPFRNKIKSISKRCIDNTEYIIIYIKDDESLPFPNFEKGTMYKNMELDKFYKLKELGL